MSLREISRRLKISRNSVRKIVGQQGAMPNTVRKDKIHIDPDLLRRLHGQCEGWMQRIHEKLTEEEGIQVSYSAKQCIIDNTNLARLRGSGSGAVIVPEMVSFAERYGFPFICHAIRHPNRKAGEERGFWTVETNFLKGRTFANMEDLNRQALAWATERIDQRPMSKTGLIPAQAFAHEQSYLTELPQHLPAPYRMHPRDTDQYGYVALDGNYYWVPGSKREEMKVLQYADHLKIFRHRKCVAEYPLPADGVKNERFSPEGEPKPRYQPRRFRRGSQQEEQRLRAIGPEVGAYLDYVVKTPGIQRHRFTRELFALSRRVTRAVFVQTVQRALRYRVAHLQTLERIAWFCMSQSEQPRPEDLDVDIDEDFRQRPAYQEGCLTDEPDLSIYDDLVLEDDEPLRDESDQSEQNEPKQNPPNQPESEDDDG